MEIIQWNINGFYRRLENIKVIINKFNPICLCIQETNFSNDHCAQIRGYCNFHKNRNHSRIASGGVAIFALAYTLPEEISLNTHIEAVAIKIKVPYKLTICNVYLPNSYSFNEEELINLTNQLPKPFVVLGDFNSHHMYWGSKKMT